MTVHVTGSLTLYGSEIDVAWNQCIVFNVVSLYSVKLKCDSDFQKTGVGTNFFNFIFKMSSGSKNKVCTRLFQ